MIRLSGDNAIAITQRHFTKTLSKPRHAYFGEFINNGEIVDEVLVTYFIAPASYTGENMVEISCHGSSWVSSEIVRILTQSGAKSATRGEFTLRAFVNGKLNLAQAEAVGDLIASTSKSAASVALNQMRGGYADELSSMRSKLLHISSMLELELDFGEEDVEFASRGELVDLLNDLKTRCEALAGSFAMGNVLKNGVPVAIIGKPNVGKSTLLNRLIGEERAIVSEIAGTTRDYLEEVVNINDVEFRFIDTAGLRHTTDTIEAIGVERSIERMKKAAIIIQLVDDPCQVENLEVISEQQTITVLNKADLRNEISENLISISAKHGAGIDNLKNRLLELSGIGNYTGDEIIVSNTRHFELLKNVISSIDESLNVVNSGLSGDLIAANLKSALEYLGEITGEFTTDEVLGNIFKNFCIGK